MKIRDAQPADAPDIAAYHRRCFESTYAGHIARGELQIPDLDMVQAQFERWFVPGSEFVTRVADVDGRPVAHVTVSANLLVHLFVDPSRQGTGLGRRLLALGESILAEAGHSAFELHARVENVAAIGFYQSAGWAMTGHRLQPKSTASPMRNTSWSRGRDCGRVDVAADAWWLLVVSVLTHAVMFLYQ